MSGLLDVVNSPWAIVPSKLDEISGIYLTHLRGEKIDIASIEARIGPMNNETRPYEVIDGVAVVPIHGVIAKRANMLTRISGGVSTELISADLKAIEADDSIKAVILDIDSPGGSTDGVDALAEQVYAMKKRTVTFANGLMASGGCWIGSASDAVYLLDESTVVGSIGVVMQKVDPVKSEGGGKVHEIYAGKYKRLVSATKPLDKEGEAYLQDKVNYVYSVFVGKMAKFKSVSVQTVLESMADGKDFIGTQAVDAGLADGIATLDSLIADLSNGVITKSSGAVEVSGENNINEGTQMTDEKKPAINAAYILEHHADIADGFKAKGAGLAKTAETARIQGVLACSMPGHDALVQALAFDGETTPDQAAFKVLQAEKTGRAERLVDLNAEAPAPAPHVQAVDPVKLGANESVEDKTKREWGASADLRDEFGSYDGYLAFAKADAGGQIKMLGGKS